MPTRIEKEPDSTFPTVVLWLNDLKELVAIVERETGGKATISDSEYKYDSLDEFISHHGETVPYLSIEAKSAKHFQVKCTVGKGENRLYIYGADSEKQRAIYHTIHTLLEARRPPISYLNPMSKISPKVQIPITLGSILLIILAIIGKHNDIISSSVFFGMFFLPILLQFGFLGLMLTSFAVSNGAFSKVYLIMPHKKQAGFIRRNWEKVLVGLISVALTIPVTLIVNSLFKGKHETSQPDSSAIATDPKASNSTPTPKPSSHSP